MGVQFIGTHLEWNMRCAPARAPAIQPHLHRVALSPHISCAAQYTVALPMHDTFEHVYIVPDRADGAVTYERLFDVVYDFYKDPLRSRSLGAYTMFGGLVMYTNTEWTRLILNATKPE